MAKIDVLIIAPKKSELPFAPYANIWLTEYSKDSEGRALLSPELMTDKEIDNSVDLLISQLETARKKAKRDLRKKNKI